MKNYMEKKNFTIFCIIFEDEGEELFYVAKTSASDLRSVLRRHLRGELSITKAFLNNKASNAKIIPLEHLHCTAAEAYRHVLCFVRLLNQTHTVVCSRLTELRAYNFTPQTEKLYQQLSTLELEDIISGAISIERKIAEEPEHIAKEEERCQLNIVGITESQRAAFQDICRAENLTQREGFAHLLAQSHLLSEGERGLIINQLVAEKTSIIDQQKATIASLEQKLKEKPRGQAADDNLKAALKRSNELVKKYVEISFPAPKGPTLKPSSFHAWKRMNEGDALYLYPDADGYSIIRLHSLCYGRGVCPPVFIHGEDIWSKKRTKLRYYPSPYFLGLSPRSPYAQPDSLWFVGYSKASDGAMALTFALPMINQHIPDPHNRQSGEYSIDELIDAANRYIDEAAQNKE